MKNMKHPAFILGIVGAILLFIGLAIMGDGDKTGHIILYAGMALGAIFWIWSIIRVAGAHDMKPFQRRFWLIAVVAVPVVGALIFHVLHQQEDKIVT